MSFNVSYVVNCCTDCPNYYDHLDRHLCNHDDGPELVAMNFKYKDFSSYVSIHPKCPLNKVENDKKNP